MYTHGSTCMLQPAVIYLILLYFFLPLALSSSKFPTFWRPCWAKAAHGCSVLPPGRFGFSLRRRGSSSLKWHILKFCFSGCFFSFILLKLTCTYGSRAVLRSKRPRPRTLPGRWQERPEHRIAEGRKVIFDVLNKANPLASPHPLPTVPPRQPSAHTPPWGITQPSPGLGCLKSVKWVTQSRLGYRHSEVQARQLVKSRCISYIMQLGAFCNSFVVCFFFFFLEKTCYLIAFAAAGSDSKWVGISGPARYIQSYYCFFSLNGFHVPVSSEAVKYGHMNASKAVISKLTPH